MGKEEIARNEQFLLFPQCFLRDQMNVSPLVNIFDIISLFPAELEELKTDISGKGLMTPQRRYVITFWEQEKMLETCIYIAKFLT